jgi:carboxylate-amine ligase
MRPLTFGVEEEFLLVDPISGRPLPAAPELVRLLAGEPGARSELMRFQFETATSVCTDLGELRDELVGLRRLADEGARSLDCRLIASGVSPCRAPGLSALTDQPRYRQLARRHPTLTPLSGTCACHVHVGVPDRDLGVQVLARLRPWLATLLAISANSPIDAGHDTGHASHRYGIMARWPTGRPPSVWADGDRYDTTVRRLIRHGAALDEGSVYFLARLSPRYPTVEVRVADVCPDVDTALLLAALVRALVMTALDEVYTAAPLPAAPQHAVVAGLTAAAHHGLAGLGVDPYTGERARQCWLLGALLNHTRPALAATGDGHAVSALLTLLDTRGTGADRQRRSWARTSGIDEFVHDLAETTLTEPTAATSLSGR